MLWAGPEGLESEVSRRLGVEETPQLTVMAGSQVTQRLRTFPEDLPLIPRQIGPVEVTEILTSLANICKGKTIPK